MSYNFLWSCNIISLIADRWKIRNFNPASTLPCEKDLNRPYQSGYGYSLGARVMTDKPAGDFNRSMVEFGWCGMQSAWILIDSSRQNRISIKHKTEQSFLTNFNANIYNNVINFKLS